MSNLSNYSLRALGVPTTSDFTPRWPKGDNNHAWNTVYYEGQWHSFMGCEAGAEPSWDGIKSSIFGKVYRKSFSAEPIMGPSPDGTEPPRLMRVAAIDVTSEYTTVSDIEIWVDNPSQATYLCVFNFGAWRAVAGAWADGSYVSFSDVGNKDILYCATRYIENDTGWGDHHTVGIPFVLHQDGSVENIYCCPRTGPGTDIVLTGWNNRPGLEAGTEVTLFQYMGNEAAFTGEALASGEIIDPMAWVSLGTGETVDLDMEITVTFDGVGIESGLYLLSDNEDPDEFREGSRPFIWTADGPVYY